MMSRSQQLKTHLRRRELLRAGLGGFASLSLADVWRRRAAAEAVQATGHDTAVILVWLRGGCSHLDTFDPKPEAPLEFRGPFAPINTNVPGIQLPSCCRRLLRWPIGSRSCGVSPTMEAAIRRAPCRCFQGIVMRPISLRLCTLTG